ncbi:M17 family peptidase N-terminal domain-containing protein [Micromonospora sp. NPDC005161]
MTALSTSTIPLALLPADCVVIGTAKGPRGPVLAPGAAAVAEAFDGTLDELFNALGATGAEGEAARLPAPAGIQAGLVLAVGLGDAANNNEEYDVEALRRAAGVAARALVGAGTIALALPTGTAEAVEAVALGGLLGTYAFTAYRTTDHAAPPVRELTIRVNRDDRTDAEGAVRRAAVLGQEVNRAR